MVHLKEPGDRLVVEAFNAGEFVIKMDDEFDGRDVVTISAHKVEFANYEWDFLGELHVHVMLNDFLNAVLRSGIRLTKRDGKKR